MLRKIMNAALVTSTVVLLSSFWDFHWGYGSLAFFGEPELPEEIMNAEED